MNAVHVHAKKPYGKEVDTENYGQEVTFFSLPQIESYILLTLIKI